MKVKYLTDVNINGALHPTGSEEEMEGRLVDTMIRNGWVMDAVKYAEEEAAKEAERVAAEKAAKVVELPKKRTYETAVKRDTEDGLKVERKSTVIQVPSLPKVPEKKAKKKVKK